MISHWLVQILATELGDETFIIAAIMAMRHSRLVVYAGAMAALLTMTVTLSWQTWVLLARRTNQQLEGSSAILTQI